MPVIAETYDGLTNDACGLHVREEHVHAALNSAKTGTSGGQYSGDIFLAFSTANEIVLPGMMEQQPDSFGLDFINEYHLDTIFEASVQAIEEAIINAIIAAESMTTVKPPGYTLEAIDHDRLKNILRRYGRLNA